MYVHSIFGFSNQVAAFISNIHTTGTCYRNSNIKHKHFTKDDLQHQWETNDNDNITVGSSWSYQYRKTYLRFIVQSNKLNVYKQNGNKPVLIHQYVPCEYRWSNRVHRVPYGGEDCVFSIYINDRVYWASITSNNGWIWNKKEHWNIWIRPGVI